MEAYYYISKLCLENIKCFDETELSFIVDWKDQPARWVTLLGENATGKTTILQSLAILLAGIEHSPTLCPHPEHWLRNETIFGRLLYQCVELIAQPVTYECRVTGTSPLKNERGRTYFEPAFVDAQLGIIPTGMNLPPNVLTQSEGWIFDPVPMLAAYGSFRRLSRKDALPQTELPEQSRVANFVTLFNEEVPLATFNQWVSSLDYRRAKGDKTVKRKLDTGLTALDSLLPAGVCFDREALDNEGKVRFLVHNTSVATPALSDGYRSILALGGDLIWRLLTAYPDSENPIMEPGIVLIDELDIHLHPRWQSWIAQKLRSVFPNIQFIVATHSPLVAMGAYWDGETGERRDDVLTLKLEINDGKTSVQRIDDDLAAMDINRALESPAFGMVAPRPPQVEEKIDRYDELLAKLDRTAAEEAEFQTLRLFMAEARPIGGRPEPGSFQAKLEAYLRESLP